MNEQAPNSEHYRNCKIEPIDYIIANGWGREFCIGNIIKYVTRYKYKNGVEDLRKAEYCIRRLISLEEGMDE